MRQAALRPFCELDDQLFHLLRRRRAITHEVKTGGVDVGVDLAEIYSGAEALNDVGDIVTSSGGVYGRHPESGRALLDPLPGIPSAARF